MLTRAQDKILIQPRDIIPYRSPVGRVEGEEVLARKEEGGEISLQLHRSAIK